MCISRTTAAVTFCFFIALHRCPAALKNKTGEAHYWGLQGGWIPAPGPLPPPSPPLPSYPVSPWWGLSDDRNVCTLEASILVVLDNPLPVPATGSSFDGPEVGVQPPPIPPPPFFGNGPCMGPGCGHANAVRMGCADIATMSRHACTDCCKMASRYYGITGEEVYGVLINSAALGVNNAPPTGSSFNRNKRAYPLPPPSVPFGPAPFHEGPLNDNAPPLPNGPGPEIPPSFGAAPIPPLACGFLPCPTTKCMCCAPRRPFTGWSQPMPPPFIPQPQPVWSWQPVGQAPPSK